MARKQLPVYSVSQINSLIKGTLEEGLPARLIVRGQISDWKRHHSGHCYFILKDESSQLSCILWSSRFKDLKFRPENGMEIMAVGHIEVYLPQGKYQFYADRLEPAGLGALQIAFEQMCTKLKAEGLFDDKYKQPLPPYPMTIGIVTSRSGAAVKDITDSILTRWPCCKIIVFDVPVQGEGAAKKIADVIGRINRDNQRKKIDILIVGRGGGSMEDLWAFNEEVTARAIFASKIPIISAVGHEVDVTIADLVADARASTPTKAGILAVPDGKEVLRRLEMISQRLYQNILLRHETARARFQTILASWVFREPTGITERSWQQVDEGSLRLSRAARQRFSRLRDELDRFFMTVRKIEPARMISDQRLVIYRITDKAGRGLVKTLNRKQLQLSALENKLGALNPRSVLGRGYSITIRAQTGRLIMRADEVEAGDRIITELAGRKKIHSRVEKISHPEE